MNADFPPLGYTQLTVSSAAVTLGTHSASAKSVLIQAETQDIRWRDDGTDPTAAVGMLLKAGTTLEYHGDLDAIKLIRATGSDSVVNVSFR